MEIKNAEPKHAMAWRGKASMQTIMETFQTHMPEVYKYVTENGGESAGPLYGRYHAFSPEEMDLEIGLYVKEPIKGNGTVEPVEIPGGEMASYDHMGPYEQLPQSWSHTMQWLKDSEYEAVGAPAEIYWTDPGQEPDQSKWRTEIVYPVRKKS